MEWMWVCLLESMGGEDDPTDSDLMGDSSSAAPLAPYRNNVSFHLFC